MGEKKYYVIGGKVMSKSDSQIHYVNANELCNLYGLNPNADNVKTGEETDPRLRSCNLSDFIILRPRYDGNYILKD